jgi:hypothetical protein
MPHPTADTIRMARGWRSAPPAAPAKSRAHTRSPLEFQLRASVLRLLIDTSTWLDLAKRRDGQKWIVPIRVLHFQQRLQLLVPQLVVDKYTRNRGRIQAATTASVSERFRLLRQDLNEYGGADRETAIELVRELAHSPTRSR